MCDEIENKDGGVHYDDDYYDRFKLRWLHFSMIMLMLLSDDNDNGGSDDNDRLLYWF